MATATARDFPQASRDRISRAISNYNKQISELTKRWLSVVTRANTAVNKGNTFTAERLAKTAEGLKTNFDKLVAKGPGGTVSGVVGGGFVGVTGAFAPEEADLGRAALGSPLWQSLKENLLDNWEDSLKRAGMSFALGGAAGHLGALGVQPLLSRPQPIGYGPETDALTNGLRQLQLPSSSPLSSAAAQLQIITKSRAGYHGPDGKFISPPKRRK